MKSESRAKKLLQSGIIYSAINFLTGLGNMAFQVVMAHHLGKEGDYGQTNTLLNGIMPLLALLPQMAIMAVTHYIAHFHAIGDHDRLQALLGGCRKFLFQLTVIGSVLAIVVVLPFSHFFHYKLDLMLVTLACTLLGLWTSLATALCQGLAWFQRLAWIGFTGMLLRVGFGWVVTRHWPTPTTAVLASTFALFAYLLVLVWRKELSPPRTAKPASPWNQEFILYLTVSAAFVVGNFCFSLGDLLVVQRHFGVGLETAKDAYTAVERLAVSLPITVAPLLTVLFTNRSVEHHSEALREQLKLIALFAAGLIFGAVMLYFLRHFCLKILSHDSVEAAEMVPYLSISMVFVGLLQAIGTWALASRWSRIALLYGILGVAYWILIMVVGHTPQALLQTMPVATGTAFVILFVIWLLAMRRHKPVG